MLFHSQAEADFQGKLKPVFSSCLKQPKAIRGEGSTVQSKKKGSLPVRAHSDNCMWLSQTSTGAPQGPRKQRSQQSCGGSSGEIRTQVFAHHWPMAFVAI